MTLIQIQYDHVSEILFNLLMNKGISEDIKNWFEDKQKRWYIGDKAMLK